MAVLARPIVCLEVGLWEKSKYHYPAWLIQQLEEFGQTSWQVEWWCQNQYRGQGPDLECVVPHEDIVDALWLDAASRRQVQVCYIGVKLHWHLLLKIL